MNLDCIYNSKVSSLFHGGIIYYDYRDLIRYNLENQYLFYFKKKSPIVVKLARTLFRKRRNLKTKYLAPIIHRTIIWLGEEIHEVECDPNKLFVYSTNIS